MGWFSRGNADSMALVDIIPGHRFILDELDLCSLVFLLAVIHTIAG